MPFVIGIDGGGTRTRGCIATVNGAAAGDAEVGSTNPHSNPHEMVGKRLADLISRLLSSAGAGPSDVVRICLGMAGVDRPAEERLVCEIVAASLPGVDCLPMNDARIALAGGSLRPYGVIVISGTGGIVYGVNEAGEQARAGGWGHILGDEGSGYRLAQRGLGAICCAHDGRADATAMRDPILSRLKLDRPEQLIGWLKEIDFDKAEIAKLSVIVLQAAADGDATAARIAASEADELAGAVRAVGQRLFRIEEVWEVVVGGGNLRQNDYYLSVFRDALSRRVPGVSAVQPRREPVDGAVLLALHPPVLRPTAAHSE